MAIGDVTNIAAMTDYVTKAASDSKVNTSAIRNKDYSNATEEAATSPTPNWSVRSRICVASS